MITFPMRTNTLTFHRHSASRKGMFFINLIQYWIDKVACLRYHVRMDRFFSSASLLLASATLVAGCNPTYNWRDFVSNDAGFRIQFPAKPSAQTRRIDLGGLRVDMKMTAAEVEDTTFAVGTAVFADSSQAQAALPAMRHALLRNIGAPDTGALQPNNLSLDIDAAGHANGRPVRIVGRFVAKGTRAYQVVVMGKPGGMPAEQTAQFLGSFTPI